MDTKASIKPGHLAPEVNAAGWALARDHGEPSSKYALTLCHWKKSTKGAFHLLLRAGPSVTHLNHRVRAWFSRETHLSETPGLETTWVMRAAALWAALFSFCALHCQKGEQSKKENIAEKGCTVAHNYLHWETKNLKPVTLVDLKYWSEPPAPSHGPSKGLCCCCYCSAGSKREGRQGVRGSNSVVCETGCSWVVLQTATGV